MTYFIDIQPQARSLKPGASMLCPPDKSITHRSIIFAAMAQGDSLIQAPLLGADCLSTIQAFQALGVEISPEQTNGEAQLLVKSPGIEQWRSPLSPLNYGNSGTTARLLTGLFAGRSNLFVTAFGDASLTQRPMQRVVSPLRQMGANITGRDDGRFLPLSVTGTKLKPAHHQVDKASAQVKSALLLAGLSASGSTTMSLPAGSRDHSEKMLQALGATLHHEIRGHGLQAVEQVSVQGPFYPPPIRTHIPGDPSSAAFFAILAAIADSGQLTIKGMLNNPTRTGFLVALERMGVPFTQTDETSNATWAQGVKSLEPSISLNIQAGSELQAFDLEPELAPTLIDEIPILAVAAMFARGTSRMFGLGELRVKESDRLHKSAELLRLAGSQVEIDGDNLIIEGNPRLREKGVEAFQYDPAGDHRLAMAASVLAKFARGRCTIANPECVDVSFPQFFTLLAATI